MGVAKNSKFETNPNFLITKIQNCFDIRIYDYEIVSDFVLRHSDLLFKLLSAIISRRVFG
jgi:hypothetical protein